MNQPRTATTLLDTVIVNGKELGYASVLEAREQAARWATQALNFAKPGGDYVTIVYGDTEVMVGKFASGQLDVILTDPAGVRLVSGSKARRHLAYGEWSDLIATR